MIQPRTSLCRSLTLITAVVAAFLFFYYRRQSPHTSFTVTHTPPTTTIYVTQTHTVTHWPTPTPAHNSAVQIDVSQEKHLFRSDGLLEVNPNAPHPIYHLISHAEQQWENKLEKSSRTLSQAVAEYERRYRRKPPVGFDAWWAYVRANDVQLPDEYDQIYHDLEPFWGTDPKDLQAIQGEWEAHEDSYTIGKDYDYDPIDVLNFTLGGDSPEDKVHLLNAALEFTELLEEVKDAIPPFRAVFSPHDNPNLLTDWELREAATQAAAEGKFIDINNPPEIKLDGWLSACPPTSKARETEPHPPPQPNLKSQAPKPKTFIHSHRLTMDPCLHPSLLTSHGEFLAHKSGPIPHRKLVPQFSYSPTMLHHDITPATPINWVEDLPSEHNLEWKDRPDERLLWRGRNTGIWHEGSGIGREGDGNGVAWRLSQRDRLVAYANDGFGEVVEVVSGGFRQKKRNRPWYDDEEWAYPPTNSPTLHKKSHFFPLLFDVSFADKPVSCEPATCDFLQSQKFEFRPVQELRSAGKYRYVLDVDGNGWSSRFKRLITSNALVFKASIYPEWWLDRIQPWVHYVPIQNGYEDLVDALVFFQSKNGTGIWSRSESGCIGGEVGEEGGGSGSENEDLGEKIAKAGREWSLAFWRREDLTAYMFRLMLEYARVMSLDREKMAFEYVGEVSRPA